ncbi:hypothetical protein H4R21_004661, partial [Coemansia helicoidea]
PTQGSNAGKNEVTTTNNPNPNTNTNTNKSFIAPRLRSARMIAGLFWASPSGLQRRCAATIITSNTLITSAACAKSDYPASKYGQGGWRIITDIDARYAQQPPITTQTYPVTKVQVDDCSNIAIIQIGENLSFGGPLLPMFIGTGAVTDTSMLYTFKTSDPSGDSFLSVTKGADAVCNQFMPGYAQDNFLCTQPVLGQQVTKDYLGGDPIIGFSSQPSGPLAVLVGVTGLYYSTLAQAQNGTANDGTAYRFNALAAAQVDAIAAVAGVTPQSLVSTGSLG